MKTVADDLFSEQEGLIGASCPACGERYFPIVHECANCDAQAPMQRIALGASGKLWSWTIQSLMPKPPFNSGQTPETFEPYGVGLVQLNCGLIVKSRLRVGSEPFRIGQDMQLRIVPFRQDEGDPVYTFEFEPEVTE